MTGTGRIKLGVQLWTQYVTWAELEAAAVRIEELGYDSLWTWDHLYPINGSADGPQFEGWVTLGAWAKLTKRVTLGLMVGANPFRNPAMVAKMAATLDHASGGRAVVGLGAAWFDDEHAAFGIPFGRSAGERLDWLDEGAALIRPMLAGEPGTARGPHYSARDARNDPPPVQARIPLLIGGGGERRTLATVARYADMWNIDGTPDEVRHKDEVLRRWCAEVGRDEREIERTLGGDTVIIRDSVSEAEAVLAEMRARNGDWEGPAQWCGTEDRVFDKLAPHVEMGFHHIYVDLAAPHDFETIERLMVNVKPRLEALIG
jgi:alkanesulfonate monooxygenase SsuD/methylene tetrahydromethanopterin reductase-like flavin-dependent oxidoreductase (luciferase family)